MIASLLALVAVAMPVVRIGWSGRRPVALAGWGLAAAGLAGLARAAGAWGLAMGVVTGTVVALAIVLTAGIVAPVRMAPVRTAPVRSGRTARAAPSVTLPRRTADLGARVAVFLLVVPVAFVAALWAGFGVQALARRLGAAEADAVTLTLFLQPTIWALLMAWQMTRAGPARMIAAPAGTALFGTLLWGLA